MAAAETELVHDWLDRNVAVMHMEGADGGLGSCWNLLTCDIHVWRIERPVQRVACTEAKFAIVIASDAS